MADKVTTENTAVNASMPSDSATASSMGDETLIDPDKASSKNFPLRV